MAGKVRIYNAIAEDCDLFVNGHHPTRLDKFKSRKGPSSTDVDRSGSGQPELGKFGYQNNLSLSSTSGSFSGRAFALAIPQEVREKDDIELYLFPNLWVLNSDRGYCVSGPIAESGW